MVDAQELEETLDATNPTVLAEEAAAFNAADHAAAPVGTWTGAPALAASTVDMVNTSAWPVEVGISSGTVTVIKKNTVTITGATSGRFYLRPGGKISITYSVAPTLQWLYA